MLKSGAGCQTPMLCCTLFKHSMQSTGFPYFSLYSPGVDFLKSSQTWRKHPETDFTHFHEYQNVISIMPAQPFLKEILNVGQEWLWRVLWELQGGGTPNFCKETMPRPAFPQPWRRRASPSHCWNQFVPSIQALWESVEQEEQNILHETSALGTQTASLQLLNPNIRSSTFQFGVWFFLYTTTFLSVKRFQTCFFFWGVLF